MTQDEAAELANEHINSWAHKQTKLVIAIDGYTGIGKTTLLSNLEKINPRIIPVHRDDFLISRKEVESLLSTARDRSEIFELKTCQNEKLEDLINSFRRGEKEYSTYIYNYKSGEIDVPKTYDLSKEILIIEGVFMFHPKLANYLWDKRIYLTANIAEVDKRRVEREKAKWGDAYFPEDHPDSYFRQVIIALKRYQELYHPEKMADLVLQL